MATQAPLAPLSPSSMSEPRPGGSALRFLGRFAIRVLFLAVFLFVPAGTLRWPAAWALLGAWVTFALVLGLWMYRNDPALLEERLDARPVQKGQKGWDKVFYIATLPVGIALLLVPGLDHRFGWTEVAWPIQALAFASLVPAGALFSRVIRVNSYLSRVVKINKDRGHKVITTGPYAVVRHPMYVAAGTMFLAWSPALGSLAGLVPGVLMFIMILLRTALEDRTLHEELPGYREYAQKTRYRLIPGIW